MEYNSRVQWIPAKTKQRDKRVVIYARVSSNSAKQLNSLVAQVSGLTRLTAANPTWLLVDVYIDIASSKTGSTRKEFNRMLRDCTMNKMNIVVTKNVSRFGRNSIEVLSALEKLRKAKSRVIFEEVVVDTEKNESRLMISIIEAIDQTENEIRSDNIKWGIKHRVAKSLYCLILQSCLLVFMIQYGFFR